MNGKPLRDCVLILHPSDHVAVARETLPAGLALELADGSELRLPQEVPAGHKIALTMLEPRDAVRKYGQVIGRATTRIAPGDWVHTHNLGAGGLALEYEFGTELREPPPSPQAGRTFMGYARPDGRVGTRNTVALVSSVNCSAEVVREAVRLLREALPDFPHVDDVIGVTHKTGCGMSTVAEDYETLQRTLTGFVDHPNVGAAMIIGLGCEVNQPLAMAEAHGLIRPEAIHRGRPEASKGPLILSMQELGGVRKSVARAVEEGVKLLQAANACRRTPQPISRLVVGTNCGGSDAWSGVTANPALGVAGDELVACGGTWLLAETSETYGAEHLLTRRAVTREVGERLLERMRWWEEYAAKFGAELDNNPSPGNKAGGLTTIYEKSLGAVVKGGTTPLRAVYRFAERITVRGFGFMDTPGHDPVSVTGLVAGGCNLIVFTTGRGSCLGFKPTPTLKVATNTPMFRHMEEDMDVDAGRILSGATVEEVGQEIFERLIALANGQPSKSEAQGLGDETFAPWTMGPVL